MAEDDAIHIPSLENGVLMIGDLWDNRASKRVGFNLFGNSITTKSGDSLKKVLEIGPPAITGKYGFIYNKDTQDAANQFGLSAEITCELLGGMIKVRGGLDFEVGWSNGMSTEEIIQMFMSPKHAVGLKNSADEYPPFYDKHVVDLLTSDKLPSATHVVNRIEIGGAMTSSIKITQTKKGDNYKMGFFIEGEANLLLLTGKMSASASVGEDIQITNYDSTIKMTSLPPIKVPTSIADFVEKSPDAGGGDGTKAEAGPDVIGQRFVDALGKEEHFNYWLEKGLQIEPDKLIGVPIYFYLTPIEKMNIKPGDPPDIPPDQTDLQHKTILRKTKMHPQENEAVMNTFKECLIQLRHWIGTDYYKRSVIATLSRVQKILDDKTHAQTKIVVEAEFQLKNKWESTRLTFLQDYLKYKSCPNDNSDFLTQVEKLAEDIEKQKGENKTFVEGIAEACKNEILAVNVSTGNENPTPDPEDPEVVKEETSPLVYFTNETDLNSWLQTQRFCKLLYKATIPEEDSTIQLLDTRSIPQRIYNMSHGLGAIYIQPGIAYPTLTSTVKKRKSQAKQNEFWITTPTGTITYSDKSEQDVSKIHFVLDLFQALTVNSGAADLSRMGRLYITYCEIHGLRLKINNTTDVIPLVELLQGKFGSMRIFNELNTMLDAIDDQTELTFLFTVDGVQSSRQVVYSLLQMQQANLKNEIWGGTFNIVGKPDVPPLFLVWNNSVQGVCLDYLSFLVLLDIYQQETVDMTKITDHLDIKKLEYTLCSKERKEFAEQVRDQLTRMNNQAMPSFKKISDYKANHLINIVTAALVATVEGAEKVASAFGNYSIFILGGSFVDGDIGNTWDPVNNAYPPGDSEQWQAISTTLNRIWEKKDGFEYYYYIDMLYNEFLSYSANISISSQVPDTAKVDEQTPKPIEQKDEIENMLKEYEAEKSTRFKEQMTLINTLVGSNLLHPKSSAKLYCAVLGREAGLLESSSKKIQVINRLKQIIKSIETSAAVSNTVIDDVISFAAAIELDNPDDNLLAAEVISRIKANVRFRRYYHVLNDLVENASEQFEFTQLTKFNLEMNRLKSISDWLNLIRVIEVMGKDTNFNSSTLEQIWRNRNFQYLIYANMTINGDNSNSFVVRALVKAFVRHHSVPKYIPSDIARELLAMDVTFDGNPIGYDPDWTDRKILLKSLQVLWVQQIIPDQFQTHLLTNALNTVTYDALKEAQALCYWNEDNQYFNQVWDLKTIYEAIIKLLKISDSSKNSKSTYSLSYKRSHLSSNSLQMPPKTSQRAEISTVEEYLKIQDSAQIENYSTVKQLLYHLKLTRMGQAESNLTPFELPERVNLLSELFSLTEPSLRNELLSIINSKYGNIFAMPLIINSISTSSYTCFSNLYKTLDPLQQNGLPRIITVIRIGEHPEGKSQFINQFVTQNAAAFASKANSIESNIPQHLKGFVDLIEICENTANSNFFQKLTISREEKFLLLNLHGNALELKDHLRWIQTLTSSFIIFWNPQSYDSISAKKAEILDLIKPNHGIIDLYINPFPDVVSQIQNYSILTTPFATNLDVNSVNGATAFSSALLRRARQPKNDEVVENMEFPKWHTRALEFMEFVNIKGIKKVKQALILQQGRRQSTLEELNAHWNSSDSIYSQLMLEFAAIINLDDYRDILVDLAELLTPEIENMQTTAWRNLNKMSYKDFGHVSFRPSTDSDPTKRQILLNCFQNNVDSNKLGVTELLTEVLKIWELSPEKIPSGINPIQIMASLFEQSCSMPVPSIPNFGFFVENWSRDFIGQLSNLKVLVVNCVGTNPFNMSQVMDSIFGISFTSSASRCQWSDSSWCGLQMRLVHFDQEVKLQTKVDSVLLLQAKPICQETTVGNQSLLEKDRQIATFLIATSNLTIFFDYQNDDEAFRAVLETSLLGLNKIDIQEKTPQLFFVGIDHAQSKDGILDMLERIEGFSKEWVDYNDISTLGLRVVKNAIIDVEGSGNIFNIAGNQEFQTLIPLSDAIIGSALDNQNYCPLLPDFLEDIGPIWDHIENNIKFPYPDFDEMDRSKIFNEKLFDILDLVDDCFNYHVEDFSTQLFEEIANIWNALFHGDEGQVDIKTKKDMLWNEVSNFVNQMFDGCKLSSKMDENTETQCDRCLEKMQVESDIQDEWEPEEDGSQFTLYKLKETVETYVSWERWHYTNLARQMMTTIEQAYLFSQEKIPPIEDDPHPELTKEQNMSLEIKIVPSTRRHLAEAIFMFPDIDLRFEEQEDNYEFLKTTPALEADNSNLDQLQADWLEIQIEGLPKKEIQAGGYYGIYQSGAVRRIVRKVMTILEVDFPNKFNNLRILNSFKLKVASHTIWRLDKIVTLAEIDWNDDYNPLQFYLDHLKKKNVAGTDKKIRNK